METVGFTRQQAEAMAEEQSKLIDERLATKADIEELRLTTKVEIEVVRADIEKLRVLTKADLETGLAKTKAQIIIWVVSIMGAQIALILGVLKFHG